MNIELNAYREKKISNRLQVRSYTSKPFSVFCQKSEVWRLVLYEIAGWYHKDSLPYQAGLLSESGSRPRKASWQEVDFWDAGFHCWHRIFFGLKWLALRGAFALQTYDIALQYRRPFFADPAWLESCCSEAQPESGPTGEQPAERFHFRDLFSIPVDRCFII